MRELEKIRQEVKGALTELLDMDRADFRPVRLLVIGCSSSEILGGQIGKASSPEAGEAVSQAILEVCAARGISAAFQCCEHLNRALVMERAQAEQYGYEEVCVVPWPKAGGSCASAAYRLMKDPVVVERVQADAGLDIGNTMIGMHLKPVAVPVRLSKKTIGQAALVCARTRPKLIGGSRAHYALDQA